MEEVTEILSPNFTKGRNGYKPEIIVIHIMAGTLEGTSSWFKDPKSQVSAHYGVGVKGQKIRYVLDTDTAWANGRVDKPNFKLYKPGINPNLYTLSIEHEGQDLSKGTATMIETSAKLVKELADKYGIPLDRDHVIGHYQIYGLKPNCPSTDKGIIDTIIAKAKGQSTVSLKEQIQSKINELQVLINKL